LNKDIIVLIGMFIVVFVIWYFVLYTPQTDTMEELNTTIQEYIEMEKQHVPESRILFMEQKLDTLRARVRKIKSQYYLDRAILDLGRHIERIGNKYGLTFQKISLIDYNILNFFSDESGQTVAELPVQVEFQGEYNAITNFLDNIDEFPFLIRFTDVSILNDDEETETIDIILIGKVVITKSEIGETEGVTNERI